MKFPDKYKCIKKQTFNKGLFFIKPIRFEDRFDIMKWRNEQMYHLRQSKLLTLKDQEGYFKNVVSQLFKKEMPNQLLFSYLKNDVCIGYGGLVHINWIDRNAEISFIMDTKLEKDQFDLHWKTYLSLISKVAFKELKSTKLPQVPVVALYFENLYIPLLLPPSLMYIKRSPKSFKKN